MNKKLIIIMYVINFLSIAGINMTNPLIPNMIVELGFPTFMFGIFFAILSIANFLFSPFWGKVVDIRGRKKIIIIGLLGYAISQIGLGFSFSTIYIIIFRLLSGFFMSAYIISAMTYLIDVTSIENRAKSIAFYSAFSTLGTSFGSLIGGFIGENNYRYTFIMQFIWLIILTAIINIILKEKFEIKNNQLTIEKKRSINILSKDIKTKINTMMISVIFISFAITNYNSSITYYLDTVFNLSPSKIGLFLSITGVISLFINFIISPLLLKRIRQEVIFITSSFFAGLCMLMAVISESITICIMWILAYLVFSNLNMPLQQSIISNISDNDNKGKILGIQNSARSVGMILGSLYAGFVFDINNKLPFLTCAIVFNIVGAVLSFKKAIH
ncbi:MAG: MFS transporter [Romboutsia sp.]|nr:MFS transporter [Romboutsia sp.]